MQPCLPSPSVSGWGWDGAAQGNHSAHARPCTCAALHIRVCTRTAMCVFSPAHPYVHTHSCVRPYARPRTHSHADVFSTAHTCTQPRTGAHACAQLCTRTHIQVCTHPAPQEEGKPQSMAGEAMELPRPPRKGARGWGPAADVPWPWAPISAPGCGDVPGPAFPSLAGRRTPTRGTARCSPDRVNPVPSHRPCRRALPLP